MATGTPTVTQPGSSGPVRSMGPRSDTRIVVTFAVGAYATGGAALTLPDEVKGMSLKGVNILNPIPDPDGDVVFSWTGDAATPKVGATVISTGAEAANAADYAAVDLVAELIYGD